MATRRKLRAQLRRYLTQPGNWRLKALVLALQESPRAIGEAWPVKPDRRRTLQQHADGPTPPVSDNYTLAHAPGSRELEAIRGDDEFSNDEVRELQQGHGLDRDEYIARALVSDSETELDELWRQEIHDTVAMGAATRKMARDATTIQDVDARKGDVPVAGQQPFATTGAEGAAAPFNEADYSGIAYDCERHEQGFAVTDELVDQATPSVLEHQIRQAGEAVENAINRQYLLNVVDNAGQDQGSIGNEVAGQDVLEATENVTDNDFDPCDVLVMHPEFRTELADDESARINWTKREDAQHAGEAWGLDLYVGSDATYNGLGGESPGGSNTWGWEAADEIGGVVHSSAFVHTVVYRDIQVSELEPPFTAIHDLQGGVASAYTDSVQASNNAISTLTQ